MLDVVVVTYNRPDFLAKVLDVLEIQESPVRVIISDDGSDTTLDWRRWKCVDKYLWTKHNGYQRVARYNEAFSFLEQSGVVLLDDDVVPLSMQWSKAFEVHLQPSQVACVRGLHRTEAETLDVPPWFSTTNVCFSRTALTRVIGGFDPIYNGHYGYEDLDIGLELETRKLRVDIGSPETAVVHIGKNQGYDVNVNMAKYKAKWGL